MRVRSPKQHKIFSKMQRVFFLVGIGFFASLTGACQVSPTKDARLPHGSEEIGTILSLLRPDHIASRYSYGGVEAKSFPSAGGGFRVWWATSGQHAPVLVDINNNQVPDFVELVARVADEIEVKAKQDGWRWPIPDDTWLTDPKDNGGDGRLDIYLYDFDAGDGKFEVDTCRQNGKVTQCTGYMILQKSFLNTGYASNEEGVRVVLSHEFFHYIQATYLNPLPGWWSEGSATWFEEYFYPAQKDFERLARYYLIEPSRSLNDRQRGPSDAFSYGAGLFVYFFAEKLTHKSVEEIFEGLEAGTELLQSIKDVAQKRQSSLEALFEAFAVQNLFTGSRSVASKGYPQARDLALVPVQQQTLTQFNWDLEVALLAVKYGSLQVTQPLTLRVRPIDGFDRAEVYMVTASDFEKNGQGQRLELDKPLRLEVTNEPVYLVFVNGYTDKTRAVRVEVRHAATAPSESSPEPVADSASEPSTDGGALETVPESSVSPEQAVETVAETAGPAVGCGCRATGQAPTDLAVFLVILFLAFFRRSHKKKARGDTNILC